MQCPYAGETHDDAKSYEQVGVGSSRDGDEDRDEKSDENSDSVYMLSAEPPGQPAAGYLHDDVTVEERTEDIPAEFFTPFQLALTTENEIDRLSNLYRARECKDEDNNSTYCGLSIWRVLTKVLTSSVGVVYVIPVSVLYG